MHLRPASEAGADGMAVMLLVGVQRQVFHQQRPWPDNAHLAAEDVKQLRQFVYACGAEPTAKFAETFLIRQQLAGFIPRVAHAAEFVEFEDLLVLSRALLTEDHGAAQLHAHQNRRHEKYWR